jgi:hypothetical protein
MTIKASSLSAKIFHGLSFSINQKIGGAMTLNLNRVALARYSSNSADSAKKSKISLRQVLGTVISAL